MKRNATPVIADAVLKCPTGIRGLDEITFGGLPKGRTTLVCGSAGAGKTLLGMEFLARGAAQYGEPGVCISFEETADELISNVASIGFDIKKLVAQKKLVIDFVYLDRSEIEETGEYDLEGLFLRLGQAVDSIGAKRVLLDSVEMLFASLTNEGILRAELRRLFRWLKDRQLTAVVTAERGQGESLTRYGIEEYISDCVVVLDNRTTDSVSIRRLRVVKYRGSRHGTNEYPFLIGDEGISVLPVTSVELKHNVSNERVSTGVPALDGMLGGQGYFRGSSVLISGTAGTGKTSLASHFVDAACSRGERCAIFSFEESADQVLRNMRSIGINLKRWVDKGLLRFDGARPTTFGLETHLVKIHKAIREFDPSNIVIDPITALLHAGDIRQTHSMLLRLIDFLKEQRITAVMTSLTGGSEALEQSQVDISSLIDTWILLRDIESGGERNRGLYVLKARGIPHSNQIREMRLTGRGVELRECYLGEAGLLTGSARLSQEAKDTTHALAALHAMERGQALRSAKRKAVEAKIAELQQQLETGEREAQRFMAEEEARLKKLERDRSDMAESRARSADFLAGTRKTEKTAGGRKK